ncbi:MAG: hypothetical protein V3S39_07740 [Thermodesulfobacteriota bacterium]
MLRKWADPVRVLGSMRGCYKLSLPRLLLYHLARLAWRKKLVLTRREDGWLAKSE